ncbi:MAG: thioredoxin family protein [Phycisphaerae bacterium]|nr:thioredoxin family protein [Phycisphaerae bacterium]
MRLSRLRTVVLLLVASLTCAATMIASPAVAQSPSVGKPPFPGLPGGLPGGAPAARPPKAISDTASAVAISTYFSSTKVTPGQDLVFAIVMDIDPGYHMWTAKGQPRIEGTSEFEDGIRPEFKATPVAGVTLHQGFAQWPEAHVVEAALDGPEKQKFAVYEGIATLFIPITIDAKAAPGPRTVSGTLTIQVCDSSTCLAPSDVPISATFEVVPAGTTLTNSPDPVFNGFKTDVFAKIRAGEKPPQIVEFNVFGWKFSIDASGAGLILLLVVAALGGFLLNLTPCVLPVIPLKIMGLSASAGSRARTFFLGLMMSAGVVAFWMALGVAVSSIKGFTSANQLFQCPLFTIGVGVFIAAMSIGLLGLFSLQLPQWVFMINPKQESAPGAFGFGMMTAILSTPCTAPLMGAAMAWATTQSVPTVLAVFAAVGFGMAIPYAILAAFPQLTAKMPKSGPASDLIKQLMALLLLAAAAFFIGAGVSGLMVNPPDPPSKLYWWVVGGISFFAGIWLLVRTIAITPSFGRRVVFGGLGAFIMAAGLLIGFTQTAKGPIAWTYYTPDRLASAKSKGDVVVIDFTAEWCLTCKTLESTVLNVPSVASILNGKGVSPIKVDITGNNVAGNDLLNSFGSVTIPLLVVVAPDGETIFKSEAYTPNDVLKAIDAARSRGATPAAGAVGE